MGLNNLKADATTGELLIGVGAVETFRVEYRHSLGDVIAVGQVVVANDEVDAQTARIGHLFVGLDATVEGDDKFHTRFFCIVDTLKRNAIALAVAVGDIEIDIVVERLQIGIDKGNRRGAVNIIVAVNKDAFTPSNRLIDTSNGTVHVLYTERIMMLVEPGSEKTSGLFKCGNTTFNK